MRPGAVTHHTDTEQRYVELDFAPPAGNDITVTMLPATESNLVPPGYYMVWIIDDQGIPCANAKFIQVIFPATLAVPPGRPSHPAGPASSPRSRPARSDDPDVALPARVARRDRCGERRRRRFVRAVNRVYYSFSPEVAHWIERRPRWRAAVRDVVVRPGTACIRAARRAADRPPVAAARAAPRSSRCWRPKARLVFSRCR